MDSNSSSRSPPSSSSDDTEAGASIIHYMNAGVSPRVLLNHLAPSLRLTQDVDDIMLRRILVSLCTEPPKRTRLPQYKTLADAVDLIKRSNKIIVLTGAGVSTSAGIPDFRSRNGIYDKIHEEYPDLQDPKLMFDIEYFRRNPLPFYQFAKALFPGQFKPTIGHQFIKCIEDHNKLLRNYTQNIDTLEKLAGVQKVIECHGSFARATCTNCRRSVDGEAIRSDIFAQQIPKCSICHSAGREPEDGLGVLKPNIVFFGEPLGDEFHSCLDVDKNQVDLLIVIGTSLKVRPVMLIPRLIPPEVPQILINKEPVEHMEFDIELINDCDVIIKELCKSLGGDWMKVCGPEVIEISSSSED